MLTFGVSRLLTKYGAGGRKDVGQLVELARLSECTAPSKCVHMAQVLVTFRHQRVYDPELKRLMHLRPLLPDELELAEHAQQVAG